MSGLRDRLRRLTSSVDRKPATEHKQVPDHQDQRLSELSEVSGGEKPGTHTSVSGMAGQVTSSSDEWSRIGAGLCQVDDGAFIKRQIRFPLNYWHGKYRLGDLKGVQGDLAVLGHLDRELSDGSQLLFFDTETMGLGVGTGNVPFMIGYGYLDAGEQFVVEQIFIRNPAEERYALSYLHDVLGRFSHLVTFNGRSFDWPVLNNRYVLHRLDEPPTLSQIDLLYPARSLWKEALPSCRLGTIEEKKLGYVRMNDLPGSEAPERYMEYLMTQRVEDIVDVFVHNERDILSLAVLAIRMNELLQGNTQTSPGLVPESGVRLALWLDKFKRRRIARELLIDALRSGSVPGIQLTEAASLWKKWHEHDLAAACWRKYCEQAQGKLLSVQPMIELAMYYEHRARDFEAAIYWTKRARSAVERRLTLGRNRAADRELLRQIDHRLNRLHRKINKPTQEMIIFH